MENRRYGGVLYVPTDSGAFRESGVEEMYIAVIRDGTSMLGTDLELLQNVCNNKLEIFHGARSGTMVITCPMRGMTPAGFQRILRGHGIDVMRCRANPEMLEGAARAELRSSLRA